MTATRSQKLAPREVNLQKIVLSINQMMDGRTDNFGSVTLTSGTTTTTITDARASENSTVVLSPRTANAAAAIGTTYVSAKNNGSFVLTHANNGQTDKTFDYALIG